MDNVIHIFITKVGAYKIYLFSPQFILFFLMVSLYLSAYVADAVDALLIAPQEPLSLPHRAAWLPMARAPTFLDSSLQSRKLICPQRVCGKYLGINVPVENRL